MHPFFPGYGLHMSFPTQPLLRLLANRRELDENKCLLPGILLKLVDVGWLNGLRVRVDENI